MILGNQIIFNESDSLHLRTFGVCAFLVLDLCLNTRRNITASGRPWRIGGSWQGFCDANVLQDSDELYHGYSATIMYGMEVQHAQNQCFDGERLEGGGSLLCLTICR